jgi:MFS family permease
MPENSKLFTFEFICLNLVSFFAFSNMAVFYSFFSYLESIKVPVEWRGFLLGLEPMSAFALRLVVIPMVHVGNAARVMFVALAMMVAALFSYSWALTVPALIILRIFHGAAFVLLVSASMALVVHFIPQEKSGQGFGFVSVSVLIPYALMPLVMEAVLPHVSSEAEIYRGVTILALPAFGLLAILRKRLATMPGVVGGSLANRPTLAEIRANVREIRVAFLLAVNLLIYVCYATVFFFMKGHAVSRGITDVGSFFTLSTLVMIGLRLSGGVFFDRFDKVKMLQVFTILLIPCFILMSHVGSNRDLYLVAGAYGLCIGVLLPLLNATLFEVSPPQFRGLNTNLALFMMDAGFFLSPYGGGFFLGRGFSFADLFGTCAGILVLNACFLVLLGRQKGRAAAKPILEANG